MKFVVAFIVLISSFPLLAQSKKLDEASAVIVTSSYDVEDYMRFRVIHYFYKNYNKMDDRLINSVFDWYVNVIYKVQSLKITKDESLYLICKSDSTLCPYYQESIFYNKKIDEISDPKKGEENENEIYRYYSVINPYFNKRFTPELISEMRSNPLFENLAEEDPGEGFSSLDLKNAKELCLDALELELLFKMKDIIENYGISFISAIRDGVMSHYFGTLKKEYVIKAAKEAIEDSKYFYENAMPRSILNGIFFCSDLLNKSPEKIIKQFCIGKNPFLCQQQASTEQMYRTYIEDHRTMPSSLCHESTEISKLCY